MGIQPCFSFLRYRDGNYRLSACLGQVKMVLVKIFGTFPKEGLKFWLFTLMHFTDTVGVMQKWHWTGRYPGHYSKGQAIFFRDFHPWRTITLCFRKLDYCLFKELDFIFIWTHVKKNFPLDMVHYIEKGILSLYILLRPTIGLIIVWYIVKVSVKQLCSLNFNM